VPRRRSRRTKWPQSRQTVASSVLNHSAEIAERAPASLRSAASRVPYGTTVALHGATGRDVLALALI
jgi:hypothetical protein